MKQFAVLFFVLTLLISAKAKSSSSKPLVTVELPLGKFEGEQRESLNGNKFFAFEGVPYAAPPTGNNRFREPQQVQKWTGTKTNNNSISCTQLIKFSAPVPPYKVEGVEDCLIMNIYTSDMDQSANLDVIVYIHAGGFMYGSGYATGPLYILDKKIVYVNFNYRLGPLGFLSTEDEVVSGNMGMLDQIMALKFVQKYIKYFGGNPKSVTLIGNSSGGFSVHFHMLSPLSKGLFIRAASLSGSMLNSNALAENPRAKAEKVAALLNCSRSSMQEAVDCMRTKSANDVVATVEEFLIWMYTPPTPFGIVIDTWAKNPSLPDHPVKLIQQGKVENIPWFVSHTNSEGLLPGCDFYYDGILDQIDSQWNRIMPSLLDFNETVDPSLHDKVSQQIRDYYMGNKSVNKDSYMDFVQILTDRSFVGDLIKDVNLHLEYVKNSSIQLRTFTYRGAESLCNKRTETYADFGASHIDDVSYMLNSIFMDASTTDQDRDMINVMVKSIVSFARNGHSDVGIEWPKATKEKLYRLHVAGPKNLKIDEELFTNASFWNSLAINENERLVQSEN